MRGCGIVWLLGVALLLLVFCLHVAGTLSVTSNPEAFVPFVLVFIILVVLTIPGLLLVIFGKKRR